MCACGVKAERGKTGGARWLVVGVRGRECVGKKSGMRQV